MNATTKSLLDDWERARHERDRAQRRVCFAATLFVDGKATLDELKSYVAHAVKADREADEAERAYRDSYRLPEVRR